MGTHLLKQPHGTAPRLASRLALGLSLLASTSCGDATPPRDVNLLLVSWDTLRASRLGTYGNTEWGESTSPGVDALAEDGVLFETAYAPRGQTHPSIASLLTGLYPATTGLRENGFPLPPEYQTLFQRLDDVGYQTGVFVANFAVDHPVDGWVARGADVSADGYGGGRAQVNPRNESRFQVQWDDRVERATTDYLDGVDTDKPFAVWAHFYDIHKPYNPPEGFVDRYGTGPDLPEAIRSPGPDSAVPLEMYLAEITLGMAPEPSQEELRRVRGLYDGTVRATDDRLGRILDKLEEMGELEDTYVVFTSDHGEELYDHNRYFFHGASIYDGVVRIPLIISGPDLQRGLRVPGVVRIIDIAPTVLDLLGLPAATDMEGTSLGPVLRGETLDPDVDHAVIEWQDLIYAVSDGRRKLILNRQHTFPRKSPYSMVQGVGFEIDCLEAYDLLADPLEQVNLVEGLDLEALDGGRGLPAEFQPLYTALRDFLADPAHEGSMDVDSLDDEARQRLAQLGYVGTGSTSAGRTDSMRGEPCLER